MNVINLITISLPRGMCKCLTCMYTMCMPSIQEGQKRVSDGNDHTNLEEMATTQHASITIYIFINK